MKFGGTEKEQTELANLVVIGKKTATSSLVLLQKLTGKSATKLGDIWDIQNGEKKPLCKVIITKVVNRKFGEIDENFAKAEGDGTFDNWHHIHFNYYTLLLTEYQLKLTEDTLLECVYFEKITLVD